MTVGVLEAVVIRDQHGPVGQGQCQHIEVNVRKAGQVSRRTGGRLGVIQGRKRRRPPLNVGGFNEHGSRRAQTLKLLTLRRCTHATRKTVRWPVEKGCRVQDPLHGMNSTTHTMKAPLTPIFLKERAQGVV